MVDSGKRLSAGKTPVASYHALSCGASWSQARNVAAAFLCCDQDVMNAVEDCVVSYVSASRPEPSFGVWPTPIVFAPSCLAQASALPSVVQDIAAFLRGNSCQPWLRSSEEMSLLKQPLVRSFSMSE